MKNTSAVVIYLLSGRVESRREERNVGNRYSQCSYNNDNHYSSQFGRSARFVSRWSVVSFYLNEQNSKLRIDTNISYANTFTTCVVFRAWFCSSATALSSIRCILLHVINMRRWDDLFQSTASRDGVEDIFVAICVITRVDCFRQQKTTLFGNDVSLLLGETISVPIRQFCWQRFLRFWMMVSL